MLNRYVVDALRRVDGVKLKEQPLGSDPKMAQQHAAAGAAVCFDPEKQEYVELTADESLTNVDVAALCSALQVEEAKKQTEELRQQTRSLNTIRKILVFFAVLWGISLGVLLVRLFSRPSWRLLYSDIVRKAPPAPEIVGFPGCSFAWMAPF